MPDLSEAANLILWRWIDARKNSISMAAQAYYRHKELDCKNATDMLAMLQERGVVWDDYPTHLKWGTFVQRRTVVKELTEEVLDRIPERHRPTGPITKNEIAVLDMPLFINVENRVEVLFEGADPILGITEA